MTTPFNKRADKPLQSTEAWLLGEAGDLKDRKFPLDRRLIVFGRDKDSCDVVLTQSFISKRQVSFETDEGGRITVKDLSSRLTTYINGSPVSEHVLSDGDRIGFGPGGVLAFRFCTSSGNEASTGARTAQEIRSQLRAGAARSLPVSAPFIGPERPVVEKESKLDHKSVLRIGRAPDNDIVLDRPGVSRYHATLTYPPSQQPVLTDLASTNGTYVNGNPLSEARSLAEDDLVFVGGFLLRVEGKQVHQLDLSTSRICAEGITKSIGDKVLLRDLTLALFPREFIGLMGPSGCGKSTLMDALNGLRPATSGSVSINGLNLYSHFNALRRSIGYVPQRDILHDALTVERTLWFAAKLRLPDDTPQDEVRRVVNDVIETVGLGEQRNNQFRQLSGGQQKRLSLAVELITKPSFLFLDEPTSPLDPESTESMMLLFRRLADQGRIVVMVTHKFEKFDEMHNVAILTRGGYLAFFGPPRASLEYFKCREPADIYRQIGSQDPEELSRRFKASPEYRQYVTRRVADTHALLRTSGNSVALAGTHESPSERRAGPAQWKTLTHRFLEIKFQDRRNTLLLLVQAPIIALILSVITGSRLNDSKTLFISAVIAIWFGANNAVRDIVSEIPIYVRERRFSLKIPSYVLSKFAVLSAIAVVQVLLFLAILIGFKRLSAADFPALFAIVYLTTLGGVSTALLLSALVNSTEKAMSVLPLILIPQLLLSGFFKPVNDVYLNARTRQPVTAEAYKNSQDSQPGPGSVQPEVIQKVDGLGVARYASALVLARWSIDGLVHVVSVNDMEARDRLAAQLSVHSYATVMEQRTPSEISASYHRRVWADLAILAAFNVLLLSLTMLVLKRKDII